jgi:hypothetical protein
MLVVSRFLICGLLIEGPADEEAPFKSAAFCFMSELALTMVASWTGWDPEGDESVASQIRLFGFIMIGVFFASLNAIIHW